LKRQRAQLILAVHLAAATAATADEDADDSDTAYCYVMLLYLVDTYSVCGIVSGMWQSSMFGGC
jgi:hypothetical protein